MSVQLLAELRRVSRKYSDWLLTLQTALVMLMLFVLIPLQAMGIVAFQAFAIAGLLAMIGGALIISVSPVAMRLMLIAFVANGNVFFLWFFLSCPYHLLLLVMDWFLT